MHLRDKSIEELLDLEEEYLEAKDNEKDGSLHQLIRLYEELFKKISRDRSGEYGLSLDPVKKKLVSYLVRYGTYIKTHYQKDNHHAKSSLEKALFYQKDLPIAYYRLGFLGYKQKNYFRAAVNFQKAIQYQEECREQEYQLNQQQLYNAKVYITNSYLYLAEEANNSLKEWETDELIEKIPDYERSSLYELINQNEIYLANQAFTVITADGKRTCSEEECERLAVENQLPDTLILYFSDRKHSLFFNGKEVDLSINHAEILRFLLLHTNEQNPATKYPFSRIFDSQRDDGEIETNTYIQNIRRIRDKIIRTGVTCEVVVNKRHHGQTAYYYSGWIPFAIFHRSDNSFTLE